MARPRSDANAIPTEVRILTAAENAFGQHGFANTRLEDIAAAAGIRRPSVLYHFNSKELLYTAVVERVFQALRETFAQSVTIDGEFSVRFMSLIEAYIAFLSERPAFAPLVLREVMNTTNDGPVKKILESELEPILDWIEQWITLTGPKQINPNVPLRSAILHLGTHALVYSSAGVFQKTIWRNDPQIMLMAKHLFLIDDARHPSAGTE